ncbi:MAG: hypothetical protein AAF501_18015 [Pseudomonadota bacterium]
MTEVSVGAIIAPAASLGSDRGPVLLDLRFDGDAGVLISSWIIGWLLSGLGIIGNEGIRAGIRTVITNDVVRGIARDHDHDRCLPIGTINLDFERPVF